MSILKTITIDGFYTPESASNIASAVFNLPYTPSDYGKEIQNFNLVPPDADEVFSKVLNKKVKVGIDSGTFRIPELTIHFESFENLNQWLFVVALQESTFNIFEHKSGVDSALGGYQFGYRNLLEWDLQVNYILKPGQGVFFRPWLFHSFNLGIVQAFRLEEV